MSELQLGGSWAGGWDEPGVLSLVIVEADPAGSGLFVYSGTPALGNPPVFSLVAPGNGQDPYGNSVAPVLEMIAPAGINTTLGQLALFKSEDANSHAITAFQADTTGTANAAANFVSANPGFTAVEITGNEVSHGTLKIAHNGYADGSDSGAAAISIDVRTQNGGTSGTKAGGIFITSTTDNPYATGVNLLNIRFDNSETVVKTTADGPKLGVSVPVSHVPSAMVEVDLLGSETHHLDLRDNAGTHCYLYTLNGALVYRGGTGTITTIAPA